MDCKKNEPNARIRTHGTKIRTITTLMYCGGYVQCYTPSTSVVYLLLAEKNEEEQDDDGDEEKKIK